MTSTTHALSPRFILFAAIVGLLVGAALPLVARAQGVDSPVAAFDLQGLLVGLVLPYVAHGLSVASVLGVLRWFFPALQKRPGEKKLTVGQVRLVRGLCVALAVLSTLSGKVPPLGGVEAGLPGLIGAGALIALLAMSMRDLLQRALKRRASEG